MKTFKVGDRVMCNGHEGAIGHVCEGQLKGMVEVRLNRGGVCLSVDDCGLYLLGEEQDINEAEALIVAIAATFRWHPSWPTPEGLIVLLHAQAHINAQRPSRKAQIADTLAEYDALTR